jgi:hypothetical protein
MKCLRHCLLPFFLCILTLAPALAQENVIHYDNLDDCGNAPNGLPRALKSWNEANNEPAPQRFTANTDNVTIATLGLTRIGSPGGLRYASRIVRNVALALARVLRVTERNRRLMPALWQLSNKRFA